ncbi:unnamed protein product [Cyclocybe aegerita]|uniref:Uncharacterized protein n=1 Tax=Cyclocybe aegerita TaxID=1973307 RepID=A0A8S0XNQ9_CYCAE|nr:unnamed protein product [Cyclocybe aegerita]
MIDCGDALLFFEATSFPFKLFPPIVVHCKTIVDHTERTDIHKSCKSIEALLNILNEYCEAAGAVVALQKKLAKSLKDMASLKTTAETAANAMHASAAIFESLSDVDSKFAKIADKEYDAISIEVKKWFKKLSKEERAHDERMASANAKIKQAGQNYEKKSKKKATDASEEHARYINLISTLGPEVSQEKYNHTLNVTQRHTATTYSVAACLARLADVEWQKSCECVRRFSPTVGPLGNWKSLCEGGWTGPIPSDLPDVEFSGGQPSPRAEQESGGLKPIEEETRPGPPTSPRITPEPQASPNQSRHPPPGYSTGPPSASASSMDVSREQSTSTRDSPTLQRQGQSPMTSLSNTTERIPAPPSSNTLEPPRAPFFDPNTGSVRSLSAFPSPPTHFPIPPARPIQRQQSSLSQSTQGQGQLEFPSSNQLAESPVSAHAELSGISDLDEPPARAANRNAHDEHSGEVPSPTNDDGMKPILMRSQTLLPVEPNHQRERVISARNERRHEAVDSKQDKKRRNSEENVREFGELNHTLPSSSQPRAVEPPRPVDRTDAGASSGSVVAAMRNRYSNAPTSTSPPPRDLPRLPLSVSNLATRYQPNDAPLSPRIRAGSPPVSRQQSLPLLDTGARSPKEAYQEYPSSSYRPGQVISNPEEDRTRRQRPDELAELQRREREQELRERELELEMRAHELEKQRQQLQTLRDSDPENGRQASGRGDDSSQSGQFGLRPRERRISLRYQLQRPLSQMELDDVNDPQHTPRPSNSNVRAKSQYSHSIGNLVSSGLQTPPPMIQPLHSPKPSRPMPQPQDLEYDSRASEQYQDSTSHSNASTSTSNHAAYCGCESCSVSKYKSVERSSIDQRQPPSGRSPQVVEAKAQTHRTEKPKGWIRRLSMPVGNAFSLDSKKHQSNNNVGSITGNYALGSGVSNSPVTEKRSIFSMDGKKNISQTALRTPEPSIQEDGRLGVRPGGGAAGRRSFEASGISNRSMTNLGRH